MGKIFIKKNTFSFVFIFKKRVDRINPQPIIYEGKKTHQKLGYHAENNVTSLQTAGLTYRRTYRQCHAYTSFAPSKRNYI